ncbi:hypothetical protein ABES23_06150 [Peribacillus frigoritolerans]|uniref:hypothetical protein n=1 Tax=Peribacillus frigoritolerans TaxID=450367 RepID=UPI003D2C2849
MMNSSQVVVKQEEYRERTISEVAEMLKAKYMKEEISIEVGISLQEVSQVQQIVKRRLKASEKRDAKGRPTQYEPIERRFF